MVRARYATRPKAIRALGALVLGTFFLWLTACSPTRGHQSALTPVKAVTAHFDTDAERFYSFDGAALGLTVWQAQGPDEPEYVVVGVHGMNDYAEAFYQAAPWWAERGVTTYAYDQRGFGRSVRRGKWPKEELLREDLRTAVKVARERHPNAVLSVVGISMGGAVAMTAFGSDNPPEGVDRLILSGPGLRGWGAIPLIQRISLWASTKTRPGWVVVPPRIIQRRITASDNIEMLRTRGRDPLNTFRNRIDQVYGVVSVMEHAHSVAHKMPQNTFFLYGANDDIIPKQHVRRTTPKLPAHIRTAYYENGYHMLMRDLSAEKVWADQLAFMKDPKTVLPSGAQPLPSSFNIKSDRAS